jgi:hypothetical protein
MTRWPDGEPSAENIANQYIDEMKRSHPAAVIPWADVRATPTKYQRNREDSSDPLRCMRRERQKRAAQSQC